MQSLSSGEDWFEVHNEPLSHACFFCCFLLFSFCKVVAHEEEPVGRFFFYSIMF